MNKPHPTTEKKNPRQYSHMYEKLVPIAIGTIVILSVGVLLLAGAIALDLIPIP